MKISRLRLERSASDVVEGGERWKNAVLVEVDDAVAFDAVVVWVGWRTHGRADAEEAEVCKKVMRRVKNLTRYPFEVPMPHGPYTYHGFYTNLDWYVTVGLESEGETVMRETNELVLHPSKKAPMRGALTRSAKSTSVDVVAEDEETYEDARLGIAVVVVLYVVFNVGVLVWWFLTSEQVLWLLPVGVVTAAYLSAEEFWTLWLLRLMGGARLEVDRSVRVGGGVDVSWDVTPKARVKVRSVKATLSAIERASSVQGTDTRTEVEVMARVECELMGAGVLEAHEPVRLEASLRVPEGSPVSFSGRDSMLEWTLEFEVDVVAGPNWKRSRYVHVGPKKS